MDSMRRIVAVWAMAWLAALVGVYEAAAQGKPKAAGKRPERVASFAWTLDEAKAQLNLAPRDAFLQYVALQLAREQGARDEVVSLIDSLNGSGWRQARLERRENLNVFGIFSGAVAVQESLQLDTMLGDGSERRTGPRGAPKEKPVKLSTLQGPTIKSHPWESMLAGREPAVSELSKYVPADQYLVQCRSLSKLLELADSGDLWGAHLFNQTSHEATSARVSERMREQLASPTDPLARPFYDLVVEDVAITGSDVFFREGTDVTLIFRLKQPEIFRARMDGYLEAAEKEHADATRAAGEIEGVEYVHIATPDRAVHVFSAYPRPDLHVRSNSRVGLSRVLAAIAGKSSSGQTVTRLGETPEFRFIRTLFPEGAPEEDVLVYLSDPFIRHLVGPKLKLAERRRLAAYNHLRMIGHASLLHITNTGKPAKGLAELATAGYSPGEFGTGVLASPFGGKYSLAEDGLGGQCSVIGRANEMVPCCELSLDTVTSGEAEAYQAFLEDYNRYWRMYFDPIAVRIRMTPESYRAETVILPLIDNSIYTGLASVLGGEPEPLDSLPVAQSDIFSIALRFDKEPWAKQMLGMMDDLGRGGDAILGGPIPFTKDEVQTLVERGLGSQVGLHICDSPQLFDFNLPEFLAMTMGVTRGGFIGNDGALAISALISALNSPVYVSIPVNDAVVVDGFLEKLDVPLAVGARRTQRSWFFDVRSDFYKLQDSAGPTIRAIGFEFGPLKWRFFLARIGKGLYLASRRHLLDELVAADKAQESGQTANLVERPNPVAHAMVRIRPEHWRQVLPDYQLGWAENMRGAVLNNLVPLSNVARAWSAAHPELAGQDTKKSTAAVLQRARRVYGVDFLSPDGGEYLLSPDGKSMSHSVYGSILDPRQPATPADHGTQADLLRTFLGATAELTFLEDGLHAVLTIDRRAK